MNAASAIPTAIAGALAQFRAVAATYTTPQQVLVIDGDLGVDVPKCYLQLGDVTAEKQIDTDLGNQRQDERFDLACVINWFDGGVGTEVASSVRTKAFGVLDQVVHALKNEPTLGGSVIYAYYSGITTVVQDTIPGAAGWAVRIEFDISCMTQIER